MPVVVYGARTSMVKDAGCSMAEQKQNTDSAETEEALKEQARAFLDERLTQAKEFLAKAIELHGPQVPVLAHVMQQFAEAAKAVAVPDDVECKAGCAYCCHTRVSTSIAEVFVIAEQLRVNLSPEVFAVVKNQICSLAKQDDTTNLDWWLNNAVPCPFLGGDEGNLCTIYEIRPFTCRSHHSTSVADCKQGFEERRAMEIPCFPVLRRGVDLYSAAFVAGMRKQGMASYEVGFIAALAIALSDEAASERWLAGEDVFVGADI